MDNLGQQLNPLSSQIQQAQAASHDLSQRQMKKSKRKKFLILFIILAIGGLGVFLIINGISSGESSATPTPLPSTPGLIRTPTPSSTPKEEVDKAGISVKILNGTGIAKEASFLQTKLEGLGYKKIESGNADSQNYTDAQVTFADDLPEAIVKEITDLLEDVYKKSSTKTSKTLGMDIQIITGLRAGQTPKATSTPTASSSSTPTPTPTPSPTQ
ncbi:hypothetical protein A2125_01120 [Candidatus Woesebacteria bacterium GWB1_43_5]|uniref:LytR/CpsA/Psr regulator C-terminal domain-containing protein n=1 Tax=Candidatus Woesebacteria bacterium GWB1_43_5 TaxID=1802474 RepID=A0A1F7WSL6_9BACT|nr:MAG: hypothetical protein A2125_01120 [Candidatus Woesebacteria bacterium GWB1_43_5]